MKKKINILMVDDQPAKLLSYEVMLNDLDENLIKAASGKEALEFLLKNDIAVVLLDVSMPELGGFELAGMISPASALSADSDHLYLCRSPDGSGSSGRIRERRS